MRKQRWRVTASRYAIDTPFLRLRQDTIALPDGTLVEDYFVRESRGFAIIFAMTGERRVLLVRQYKHGIGRELLELPAGALDSGETPLDAAVRELKEETGYTAPAMTFVRSFVVDPTNADTIAHLFIARGAHPTCEQHLDVTENITVESAALDELPALVQDGTIDSIAHVASIYVALDLLAGETLEPNAQ